MREDDATITDTDQLWRRIPPDFIVFDENIGGYRPSSQAFTDSSDGHPMSIYIALLVVKSRRTAEDLLGAYPGYSMAGFKAGLARRLGLGVTEEPDPGHPEEIAHGVVFGKKTKRIKRKLSLGSSWVTEPPMA